MAFDPKVLAGVLASFETKRLRKKTRLLRCREEVYALSERVSEIDAEVKTASIDIIRASLNSGSNPAPRLEALREMTTSLRLERAAILQSLGKPADYLDEAPDCPLCGDSGFLPSGPCSCLRDACAEAQLLELSHRLPVKIQTFDTFRLDVYSAEPDPYFGMSPRENMERVFDIASEVSSRLSEHSPNLFLSGGPGLGKTFLLSAIAANAANSGRSVIYGSSAALLAPYETAKFSRDPDETEKAAAEIARLESVDLLLYDDLGSEMPGAFTNTALYTLLNNRLTGKKKTAVAGTLSSEALAERYSPAIVSRLEGEFLLLPFFGEDIRVLLNV